VPIFHLPGGQTNPIIHVGPKFIGIDQIGLNKIPEPDEHVEKTIKAISDHRLLLRVALSPFISKGFEKAGQETSGTG
jgi:hypothetical protein